MEEECERQFEFFFVGCGGIQWIEEEERRLEVVDDPSGSRNQLHANERVQGSRGQGDRATDQPKSHEVKRSLEGWIL
jgi:hypothetical protein